MKSNIVEVEISCPKNESLFFGPLMKRLRGRYELTRTTQHDGKATSLAGQIPSAVPGQRIGLNLESGEAYLVEPLRGDAYETLRAKVVKKALLAPAREDCGKVDLATFVYWLRRLVESNKAVVVVGELPEQPKGNVKKSFFSTERKSSDERLAEAIERQTVAIERQGAAIERQGDLFAKILAALTKTDPKK